MNKTKRLSVFLAIIMLLSVMIVPCKAGGASALPNFNAVSYFSDIMTKIKTALGISINEKSDIDFTLTKEFVTDKKEYTPASHASTILKLPDGRLMCAWFGGKEEGAGDVKIWYSFFDGEWGNADYIRTEKEVAHWNPVLLDCGSYARLFFKEGAEIPYWQTMYCDYSYQTKSFSGVQELVKGDTTGGRGPVKNKCLVTRDGTIIAGASTEQGDWKIFFDISKDGGSTWERTDYVTGKTSRGKSVQAIQPTLWQDGEGAIHALCRTKNGYIFRTDSLDGGYTWSELYEISLPNNSSGIDSVMADNGYLYLVYNPFSSSLRSKLMLSVSKDNGETWEDITLIEKSILPFSEFSYPAIICDGNKLHITYTYNRKCIKYAMVEIKE